MLYERGHCQAARGGRDGESQAPSVAKIAFPSTSCFATLLDEFNSVGTFNSTELEPSGPLASARRGGGVTRRLVHPSASAHAPDA